MPGLGSFTAEERAQAVNERLRAILASPLAKIKVGVEKSDMGLRVVNEGKPIIAVTDADARAEKVSADVLAESVGGDHPGCACRRAAQ